ncbi:RelA/SpoT domain-containing protein [Thiomicrorhabdus heinhorstiae]|uniref:RelA/SpoT domain-containing protein n=1 Tax=Thiomicrorhabdus heinhorstiae TaxID=2748010 RepID=A0ABS0BUQ2_9GAMM|nr:RelA/SpoT domain-containing protein [Thiomicrorhabdus heinhorstiae]MBF6057505.1 RelA/SpoT domain-containing protein [Thiomicrorhabdus heinhorstiae]
MTYTGNEVKKAGEALIDDNIFHDKEKYDKAMDVLSYWRSQHEIPLEHALSLVKKVTREIDNEAIFAKRLKRTPSIIKKLKRFSSSNMKLKSMQDVGGCRVVVSSPKKLQKLFKKLKKLPYFNNSEGKLRVKDYVTHPKDDGYRSIHLVGRFPDRNQNTKQIEIQLRTRLQHDWATTLEIVELFTGEALKSNGGSIRWRQFFALASEQFALMENIHIFHSLNYKKQQELYFSRLEKHPEKLKSCLDVASLDRTLGVLKKLHHYTESLKITSKFIEEAPDTHYMLLLVDTKKNQLTYENFTKEQFIEAEEAYTDAEKEYSHNQGITVALVYASALGGIKEAYPNYFADSREFISYLTHIKAAESQLNPGFIQKFFDGLPRF